MKTPTHRFRRLRLESCRKALSRNRFGAFVAESAEAARHTVADRILPGLSVKSAAWGDSTTLHASGIREDIRHDPTDERIETFDSSLPRETVLERRRQALTVDLFLTGTNAVTEDGRLVNLDMTGNRTGAIAFGPQTVVLMVGKNKVVSGIEAAAGRIQHYAAPINAIRHERWKSPCRKTGRCLDCNSPHRIWNTWTLTEKSDPEGRIRVILITEDPGL